MKSETNLKEKIKDFFFGTESTKYYLKLIKGIKKLDDYHVRSDLQKFVTVNLVCGTVSFLLQSILTILVIPFLIMSYLTEQKIVDILLFMSWIPILKGLIYLYFNHDVMRSKYRLINSDSSSSDTFLELKKTMNL